jgi:hypothetical protein
MTYKELIKLHRTEMYRFWQKVELPKTRSGCWRWKGYVNSHGYGVISFRGTNYKAHRIAFFLAHDSLNEEQMVLHKCDLRLCCNPNHLYQGDAKRNSQDALSRGRFARLYGESNGNSKLTGKEVKSIRQQYRSKQITQKTLAQCYGVSTATISYICSGGRWTNFS